MRCGRTWSAWRRKRGRKRRRVHTDFIRSFLGRDIASLASVARKRGCSETHVQDVLRASREHFIRHTPWPDIPEGPLILVADAVLELVERRWRTVHLLLVRPVAGVEATILPPHIMCGTETPAGWRAAIATVPESAKTRIRAVVCDGHNGLVLEARAHHWILQRCHFHLIARLQMRLSRRVPRNRRRAQAIFSNLHTVLESEDSRAVRRSLSALDAWRKDAASNEVRRILAGFLTNHRDYRSYLTYPELRLPTTNNTAESLGSTIADLKQRLRGFPTMRSFEGWITALLRFKRNIACNGFHPQKNVG